MGHVGGLVALAAMGDRRQEGGIRLDERAVQRHGQRGLAHVVALGEGEDAGKRDVEARGEVALRVGDVAGVAVDDTPQARVRLDHVAHVVEAPPGAVLVADVDDHRQVVLDGHRALGVEGPLLERRIGPVAVVVQARLTDGHVVARAQQLGEGGQLRVDVVLDVVRMDAGCGKEGRAVNAQRLRPLGVLDRRGHDDGLLHAVGGHVRHGGVVVAVEALPRQVAVRVDEARQRIGSVHGRHTTLIPVMGRNVHATIMKAVPWVAVGVLGIFSISQLASRGEPSPQPAAPPVKTSTDRVLVDKQAHVATPPSAAPDDGALQGALLSLRRERAALQARTVALERALARERLRGEQDAAVAAALGAQEGSHTKQLERLTQQLADAQAKITALIDEKNDTPSDLPDWEGALAAFMKAEGDARVAAADSLLLYDQAIPAVGKDAALRMRLVELVKGLPADANRDDLAGTLLYHHFAQVAAELGPAVVLRPAVVLALLHHEAAGGAAPVVAYVATHAASLGDAERAEISAAVSRIVNQPAKHRAETLAAGARTLGLLRPAELPVEPLQALLAHEAGTVRTASAYALARAPTKLDAGALRVPCLRLLASEDPAERLAGTMLGERVFEAFAFDPHASAEVRAKALDALKTQADS